LRLGWSLLIKPSSVGYAVSQQTSMIMPMNKDVAVIWIRCSLARLLRAQCSEHGVKTAQAP